MTRTWCEILLAITSLTSIVIGARGDGFGTGAGSFKIDFVNIANPGNAANLTGSPNPAGAVSNTYRIGKYEISENMIDLANEAGGLGITKDTRGPDKPATNISWFEAARFINWLNTSTGNVAAYKNLVGNVVQKWLPGEPGYNAANPDRNSLAKYFLPSVDEWYKAAYYDPTSDSYSNYPTGSGAIPTPVASGTAAGTAVYGQSFDQGPANVMLAGGLSRYGTMGQGGNVWEWEEGSPVFLPQNRYLRGGSWNYPFGPFPQLMSSAQAQSDDSPSYEFLNVGFRVASISVPEPTSAALALSALAFLIAAARRSCHKRFAPSAALSDGGLTWQRLFLRS
jgi:sulfatase modifying factor 1